jgi:hypothetical protein
MHRIEIEPINYSTWRVFFSGNDADPILSSGVCEDNRRWFSRRWKISSSKLASA